MKFNKLYKLLTENVFDFSKDENTFESWVTIFYESEYKLNIARFNDIKAYPLRKQKIVEGLEDKCKTYIAKIKSILLPVFNEWLDKHAITNPKMWAKKRVEENEGDDDLISIVYWEWDNRRQNAIPTYRYNSGPKNNFYLFAKEIIKNINKLPVTKELLNDQFEIIKDEVQTELDSNYDEESTNIVFNSIPNTFETYEEAKKYIDNMQPDIEFYEMYLEQCNDIEDFSAMFDNEYAQKDVATELNEIIVFPIWYKEFTSEKRKSSGGDIVTVRNTIQKIYDRLKKNNDVYEDIGNISLAINAVHVGGDMLEYVYEYINNIQDGGDIEIGFDDSYHMKKHLDELSSDKYHAKWDEDMKEAGFNPKR